MENFLIISVIALWIFVLVNLAISLALVRRLTELLNLAKKRQRPETETLKVGEEAPELSLVDLSNNYINKAGLLGTETAMVFVSPTCEPCREKMPDLREAYWNAETKGIKVLVVSLADAKSTGDFARMSGFDAPIYFVPPDSQLIKEYKVSATPTFYLIDSKGYISYSGNLDGVWDSLSRNWTPVTSLGQ